jgi:hypothetical protein
MPEALATDHNRTPGEFRNAGKITLRAKLPAPMQLTLTSPFTFVSLVIVADLGIAGAFTLAAGYSIRAV